MSEGATGARSLTFKLRISLEVRSDGKIYGQAHVQSSFTLVVFVVGLVENVAAMLVLFPRDHRRSQVAPSRGNPGLRQPSRGRARPRRHRQSGPARRDFGAVHW